LKIFEVSKELPFYWRLRQYLETEFRVVSAPFKFELTESGLLTQQRNDQTLKLLSEVYRLPANIGYFQEGYGFAEKYFQDVIEYMEEVMRYENNQGKFVEIGCGGMLVLNYFKNRGFDVVGVDPSPLSAEASIAKNIPLINDFFTEKTKIANVQFIFHYDLLEHIEDPIDFLQIQHELLGSNGLLIFSVPNPEPSMDIGDISPAMHQHLNYFSRNALFNILWQVGFVGVTCKIANYGGSLYFSARKGTKRKMRIAMPDLAGKETRFFETLEAAQNAFKERLDPILSCKEEVGLYVPLRALPYIGAMKEIAPDLSFRLIDDTVAWNGKYFDGVAVPVEDFRQYCEKPAPVTIVFSLTFEREIIERVNKAGLEVYSLRNLLSL
jgi:SAM-dependent methyltransferase